MIDRKSRYRTTRVLTVTDELGQEHAILDLRVIPPTSGSYRVVPTATDRLDHLAFRFYQDPLRFWQICDAADALDPFDALEPGRPVTIPPNR